MNPETTSQSDEITRLTADLTALRETLETHRKALQGVVDMIERGWIPPDTPAVYADACLQSKTWDAACQAYRDSQAYQTAEALLQGREQP